MYVGRTYGSGNGVGGIPHQEAEDDQRPRVWVQPSKEHLVTQFLWLGSTFQYSTNSWGQSIPCRSLWESHHIHTTTAIVLISLYALYSRDEV